MNSIKVWDINKECDTYDISIETSESVSPAMLHTTARLMEGLGCTVIQTSASTTKEQTMSTLDILGNTSEQADSVRLMLKIRGMKDGHFIDDTPLIILKADNHQDSDKWDVYISKSVYPTAESYGTLAGILRMLANDVEIMAHEKEMGGRR